MRSFTIKDVMTFSPRIPFFLYLSFAVALNLGIHEGSDCWAAPPDDLAKTIAVISSLKDEIASIDGDTTGMDQCQIAYRRGIREYFQKQLADAEKLSADQAKAVRDKTKEITPGVVTVIAKSLKGILEKTGKKIPDGLKKALEDPNNQASLSNLISATVELHAADTDGGIYDKISIVGTSIQTVSSIGNIRTMLEDLDRAQNGDASGTISALGNFVSAINNFDPIPGLSSYISFVSSACSGIGKAITGIEAGMADKTITALEAGVGQPVFVNDGLYSPSWLLKNGRLSGELRDSIQDCADRNKYTLNRSGSEDLPSPLPDPNRYVTPPSLARARFDDQIVATPDERFSEFESKHPDSTFGPDDKTGTSANGATL
jgi:hypothetical protein